VNDISVDENQDEDDDWEDSTDISDLFPFFAREEALIQSLSTLVRASLPSLEVGVLNKVSKFLFALERLPYASPGVSVDLSILERGEGGSSYVSVELTDQVFRLSRGGSEYTPGVGSDSYVNTDVQLETGGFREGSSADFEEWLYAFRNASGSYAIYDNGDDVELSDQAPGDGWERLANYWELVGESEW
jgi:hypothetical protein